MSVTIAIHISKYIDRGLSMNILICDDRIDEAKDLTDLLHDSDVNVNTTVFHNGHDALDYFHTGAVVDVCILDIIMPKMSGIALAEKLRADGFTGEIIFLSTSNDYAWQSYQVKAFSYLLKPPAPENINHILKELEHVQKSGDTNSILLKTVGITKSVPLRHISHVEVIQHKVHFRLTDGSVFDVSTTFGKIAPELLNDPRFVQCHRSYIVNLDDITEISEKEITMSKGIRIPLTRSYREVRNTFFKWKFERNRR